MKKFAVLLSLVILLLGAFSCKKDEIKDDEPNPPISDTPEIELLSVHPDTVVEFKDSLVFTIQYLDGDGNIGHQSADSVSLTLADNRADDIVHKFHVPPVSPDDSDITVRGEFSVHLDNVILLDPNNQQETATFTLRLRDRSGNWSNKVTTGEVLIEK